MSNYDVARHLDEDPVPDRLVDAVISHLDDAPVPEEKSIVEQLIENTKASISGQGVNADGTIKLPNKIEIKGNFDF